MNLKPIYHLCQSMNEEQLAYPDAPTRTCNKIKRFGEKLAPRELATPGSSQVFASLSSAGTPPDGQLSKFRTDTYHRAQLTSSYRLFHQDCEVHIPVTLYAQASVQE